MNGGDRLHCGGARTVVRSGGCRRHWRLDRGALKAGGKCFVGDFLTTRRCRCARCGSGRLCRVTGDQFNNLLLVGFYDHRIRLRRGRRGPCGAERGSAGCAGDLCAVVNAVSFESLAALAVSIDHAVSV